MNKNDLIASMKAESIPAGWSGLWFIRKTTIEKPAPNFRRHKPVIIPPGTYTFLYRLTDSTLYNDPPGEVVMEDTPFELRTHLGFVMQARGKVLVTGLGLGCVVRGLLSNPNVGQIVCIENSRDVLKLVTPHMRKERLEIIEADALEWTSNNKEPFDCAWHDVWTNRENGEPHLDHWHATLLMNCRKFIRRQGAWGFEKLAKKVLLRRGFDWIG